MTGIEIGLSLKQYTAGTGGAVEPSVPVSITFDSWNKNTNATGDGSTNTFSVVSTGADGAERLVFIGAAAILNAGNDFTACTIDGVTATKVGTTVLGTTPSGTRAVMAAFRAAGTANSPVNVVVTNGVGTAFGGLCTCFTLSGAGTLLAETHGTAINPTLSVNTVTDGAVAAAIIDFDTIGGGPSHTWTGLTEHFDAISIFSEDSNSAASANISAGETPRAISIATSGTPNQSAAALALSFNPADGESLMGGVAVEQMHDNRMRRT